MRREPIEKICLNHHVDALLHITAKDEKTWLWAAMDYAEGEWLPERFALRFKTAEIAREFKQSIDDAVVSWNWIEIRIASAFTCINDELERHIHA